MKPLIIGLTGPTGAGKSTVCEISVSKGFTHIDADKTARECTEKGSPLLPMLAREFGDILNPDGTLSRKALARAAFETREKTEKLNRIMLPFIVNRIESDIKELVSVGKTKILLDAPTLFEAGADKLCSTVIGVLCPYELRLQRIMSRDSIAETEARLRMDAGKTDEFYMSRCEHIIYNNGSQELLEKHTRELFDSILKEVEV